MKGLYLSIGFGGVLAFLGTGLYMAMHFPAAYAASEEIRYMYRANHVYLLLASLINLAVGIYWTGLRTGWRGTLAGVGTWFLFAAPLVLLYAFFFEASHGMPERVLTLLGVAMLLAGVLAQWPNRVRR